MKVVSVFQEAYRIRPRDTLTRIARSRGYLNPGPIFAYPPNRPMFPNRAAADHISAGSTLYIPWHPDMLRKLIATSVHLMEESRNFATRLIERQVHDAEELEEYLHKIDAINMILQINVSIGSLIAESVEHGGKLTTAEIIEWLADSRAHMLAGDLAPLVIPSPTAPKKDFKFFIRHTLGPWTPSFWASVWVACREGDLDLYLYGTDAVSYRNSVRIKEQAEQEIGRLKQTVNAARWQLMMPFYLERI